MNTISKKIIPLILAGGSGTRLWPASRSSFPKQFQSLYSEKSLFQETLMRLNGVEIEEPIIIVNEEHKFIVQEQLQEINFKGKIIIEPESRNTAPAVALGAHFSSMSNEDDCYLLILAADHAIGQEEEFNNAIMRATYLAEKDKIITFGITPSSAHTGYGYIEKGKDIKDASAFNVLKFVEKPNKELAETYLKSKNYLWNSGMFVSRTSTLLNELELNSKDIYEYTKNSFLPVNSETGFIEINKDIFSQCKNESLDFAVMEKSDNLLVQPLLLDWSDLGSWNSLREVEGKDAYGNVIKGDVHISDSNDCYIKSEGRFISALGLKDITIIDTKDALLVSSNDKSENIKESVEYLKANNKSEWSHHSTVYRPWGKFESIEKSETFQVKKITVKPKERISLQMHHHRAEHWIVVTGTAKVTCDEEVFLLQENESTFIPKGSKHRLENTLDTPLVLIEVQSGSYLGEDDIVRFDDKYGRS